MFAFCPYRIAAEPEVPAGSFPFEMFPVIIRPRLGIFVFFLSYNHLFLFPHRFFGWKCSKNKSKLWGNLPLKLFRQGSLGFFFLLFGREEDEMRLSWLISLELWVSKVGVLKLYFLICCGILFAKRLCFFSVLFLFFLLARPLDSRSFVHKKRRKKCEMQRERARELAAIN